MPDRPHPGTAGWFDLTVEKADELRDFYSAVVGWKPEPLAMGDYSDYVMRVPATGDAAAGVCHARGVNADLPAQWLVYVNVADLEASLSACEAGGGRIASGPRTSGDGARYCVIQDPVGAFLALYQPA